MNPQHQALLDEFFGGPVVEEAPPIPDEELLARHMRPIVSQAFGEELTWALLTMLPIEQQAPLLDRVAQQVKARIEEPFNTPEVLEIVDQMRARAIARLG
jgi:hypothetical protein